MIKLITLNVEGNLHLETVRDFLAQEHAEIVCLQEVFESDARIFAEDAGMHWLFMPMTVRNYMEGSPIAALGVALLSRYPLSEEKIAYYHKPHEQVSAYDSSTMETVRDTVAHGVIIATIRKDGSLFMVATTHFTWTPNGRSDRYQREDVKDLLAITSQYDDLVMCGDFNVPRDFDSTYDALAESFTDNIPLSMRSTIDIDMHKSRDDRSAREKLSHFVVDYIFSTPGYAVHDVRQQFGVSDHSAIIANVSTKV